MDSRNWDCSNNYNSDHPACDWPANQFKVYAVYCPKAAGISSCRPATLVRKYKLENEWMDILFVAFLLFHSPVLYVAVMHFNAGLSTVK